jgi:integrase
MQEPIPKFALKWRADKAKYYVTWWEGRRSKRVSTGTDDAAAARRFLAEFITGWITPTQEEKESLTLSEIADIFEAHKKEVYAERFASEAHLTEHFRRRSENNSNHSIQNALKPVRRYLGHIYVRDLTNKDIRTYIQKRKKDGKALGTIRKSLTILTAACNYAKREGIIEDVPHIEKPSETPPKEAWAKPQQVKALMAHMEDTPHLKLFAMLALHTLSRKRAICELKWDQVDFDRGIIDFNPPGRSHTKKRRVPVPMNVILFNAMKEAYDLATTDYVIEFRGKPCFEIGVAFRRHTKAVGFEWLTPHTLRHSGATLMAQQAVPMWEIAGIMGDRLETVEKHYLKHHPDYLKNATSALAKLYA